MNQKFVNQVNVSPFDAICLVENGQEFWSARDLQEPLGYASWQKFEDAIDRAMTACKNSGHEVKTCFIGSDKTSPMPNGGVKVIQDYHLTRYACYLVAMNGDPRKPEIAAAQTYFAIKTREAETAQEQIKQPQEQPQVHPLQGWEPNLPAGADELARAIRYEQAKLRFLQEAQAYHYPQKRKKHVGGADKMVSDVKQLPAPKQKTPEDIQSAIVRHLRKHGAMTRNQLHTRFLKNCDDLTLQVQLKALEAQGVVRKFDTVHAPEGKYALMQLETDIS